jgi:hypothetical protein
LFSKEVKARPQRIVAMVTGTRIVDMLAGEQWPPDLKE